MDLKNFENVECVWKAIGFKGTRFQKILNFLSDKYNVKLENYWDLYKWSIENIPEFWAELWTVAEIKCSKTYDQVIDLSCPMSSRPKWFLGARLNVTENILRFKDDKIALTAIGENREKKIITHAEVYEQTKLYAAAFRKSGLKKGQRVVCYISNREEAIFAMLATASMGAVWVGVLPLLGAQAVLDRVQQVDPTVILTADRILYDGRETDMLTKLKVISKGLPTLEKVIIVPTLPGTTEKDISDIPNSCFLDDFLDLGRNKDGSVPDIVFEQLPFSHPFQINYTSGTTGPPKAIVHDAGFLLTMAKEQIFLQEPSRIGNMISISPAGWASWNMCISSFFAGKSLVLYDGSPYFLSPTYFWDLIDEYEISFVFLTPSILDDFEKKGYIPGKNHKLTSLRMIVAGASVVKPQNYNFVYQKIKPGIIFCSVYGSTEIMGSLLSMHYSLPFYKGEIPCPALASDIQCLNEDGEPVIGEFGDLVITKPLPSLLSGLYGDTDGSKFKERYFSKYPDKFNSGDIAAINPKTKGIIIYGRSDEVLKQYGCRFGSIEIYNVVNKLSEIHDSLVTSQYNKSRDERAVLFLKIREGHKFNDELVKKVKDAIANELTHQHIPRLILEVPEIPYNINGKKMELLVKKLINGLPYNDDVVMNRDCLKYFKEVPPHLD